MIRRLFDFLKHGRDREAELREEIDFHLAERTALNRNAGIDDPNAAARRQFGSRLAAEEATRETWRGAWITGWTRDAAYALRGFRRSPAFFLAATATLALGIGAATAVFSVVDPLLFRPLPYRDSSRLISIGIDAPFMAPYDWFFWGTYQPLNAASLGLESLTSWSGVIDCDIATAQPRRVACASTEASFAQVLGLQPQLGRFFTHQEDLPNSPHVALLSDPLWRNEFGGNTNVIGSRIDIDGVPREIIGVLPANMELPDLQAFDVLLPQARSPTRERNVIVRAIGRLAPGSTVERVTSAMTPIFESYLTTIPADIVATIHPRLRIQTLFDQQTRNSRLAASLLLAAALCLLAIAFSNVANLILARASTRRHETALRAQLGASSVRLIREWATESLLLTIAASIAGTTLDWLLLRTFRLLAPAAMPRLREAALDTRVLLITLAVAAILGVAMGVLPRLRFLTSTTVDAGDRITKSLGIRPALLIAQVAASCVLVTGAGLLLSSAWRLAAVPTGMQPDHVTTASFVLNSRYSNNDRLLAFFQNLERETASIPGIASFAITDTMPPASNTRSRPYVALANPGGLSTQSGMDGIVLWRYITPGYFATLGIPILEGRGFNDADRAEATAVILSRKLARRLFGAASPLGRSFRLGNEITVNVIGVVGDVKNQGLSNNSNEEMYFLRGETPTGTFLNQPPPFGWRKATLLIRSNASNSYMIAVLRERFRQLEPQLPVTFGDMESEIGEQLVRPRFSAALFSLFAAAGLILAAVGLTGVINFFVAERRREIGIRLALGAQPAQIRASFLRDALRWTALGLAIGVTASLALTQMIQNLLFQVSPHDPAALSTAAGLLALTALVAVWLPSTRASQIDPAQILRSD